MGRYISTTGTAGVVTKEVSTTYSASVNDRILADSTGGAFTVTLPISTGLLMIQYNLLTQHLKQELTTLQLQEMVLLSKVQQKI